MASAKAMGIGILRSDGSKIAVVVDHVDLGLELSSKPPLAGEPHTVRTALGPAYEAFEAGRWQEGFDEACQALEQAARKYLQKGVKAGSIKIQPNSKGRVPTPAQIGAMPIGPLIDVFDRITSQTKRDQVAQQALARINKDRVRNAHKRRTARADKAVRQSVPTHVWAIVNALREILR
jgi:hypothetical protein